MLNALEAPGASADGRANELQVVRMRGFIRSTLNVDDFGFVLDDASLVQVAAFLDDSPSAHSDVGVAGLCDHAWVEI